MTSVLLVDTIKNSLDSADTVAFTGGIHAPGTPIQIVTATTGIGTATLFTFNGAARLGCVGAAITPKFASSKILITGFVHGFINGAGSQCGLGLELVSHPTTTFNDGSTVAVGGTTQLFGHEDTMFLNTGTQLMGNMNFQYENSPGSTSTIHYSVAVSENNLYAAGTSQINWSNGTTGGRSKITLTEIAQ
jgi:hypothetical protein